MSASRQRRVVDDTDDGRSVTKIKKNSRIRTVPWWTPDEIVVADENWPPSTTGCVRPTRRPWRSPGVCNPLALQRSLTDGMSLVSVQRRFLNKCWLSVRSPWLSKWLIIWLFHDLTTHRGQWHLSIVDCRTGLPSRRVVWC